MRYNFKDTVKSKAFTILLVLILMYANMCAQTGENRNYNVATNFNCIGVGYTTISDPYLSPFEYSGTGLEFISEKLEYFSVKDTLVSAHQSFNLQIGQLKHPTKINSMQYFSGMYDLSYHYRAKPMHNLTCLLGGSWDFNIGGKYVARNVNNPFSLDLYSNLNLSLAANYKFNLQFFKWFNQDFRIEYGIKTPFIGCLFAPHQGESYYEIFTLNNYKDVFHFTSFHNQRNISQKINLDIPVKFTTIRLGATHHFMQYNVNDMVFHKNNLSVYIGWISHLYVFQGTKNKPPKNFKQAY